MNGIAWTIAFIAIGVVFVLAIAYERSGRGRKG